MKVMVTGSGGREHAIIKKIAESRNCEKIYALPGNGGMKEAETVPISAMDIPAQVEFAEKHGVDFVVVAADDPLNAGAVDAFHKAGIKCFGPEKNAAIIEGSKIFAKNLMKKYGIPTAEFEMFDDIDKALSYVRENNAPIVVKADGLALGKGVTVAQTAEEAENAVISLMKNGKFGDSGKKIVIEECMTGPEVSVLSFTDGKTLKPMISSMDHKRAFDGDLGPNTGGMGAVAPNPYYTKEIAARCMKEIFLPTIDAMNKEGRTFKGCLYFGLMLTKDGPKVVEYNCRFGDPETQTVLPLLESDLLDIMTACEDGRLEETEVNFSDKYSCCVVKASNGYPVKYDKGYEIKQNGDIDGCLYFAGAKKTGSALLTDGGRVLGVTTVSDTLKKAVDKAYREIDKIHFDNEYFRHDIGRKALEAEVL